MCKDAHELLSQFDGVSITMDYINENGNAIKNMCYDGATDVGLIRIVTSKYILEFY